eukprot:g15939.t1
MANPIKATGAKGARGLLLLAAVLHASLLYPSDRRGHRLLQLASAATTSASSVTPGDCHDGDAAIDACGADAECAPCLSGWGAVTNSSAADACEDRLPNATVTTPCEESAVTFCCNLGGDATAEACMRNGLFVAFLGCFMEGFQCSIEDMPCFDPSVFTAAPTATPTAAPSSATSSPTPSMAATAHPSASPSFASSYEDRGFETTSSPSSSSAIGVVTLPADLLEACAEETAACDSDEVCQQGCVTGDLEMVAIARTGDEEDYSTCQLSYLLGKETSSVESVSDVCDVVSSTFCCSGTGGIDAEADCAANEAAQDLWSCAFEFYECSMEDANCNDFVAINSAVRRPVPGDSKIFSIFWFRCCVALLLGFITVEF